MAGPRDPDHPPADRAADLAADPAASSAGRVRRRPHRVFGVGEEPDPRFTLANERTALAWVRTSLAFVVAGLAAAVAGGVLDGGAAGGGVGGGEALGSASTGLLLRVVAVVSVLVAAWLATTSLLRWGRTERAIRLRRPLPAPSGLWVVVLGVLALAALTLVTLVLPG